MCPLLLKDQDELLPMFLCNIVDCVCEAHRVLCNDEAQPPGPGQHPGPGLIKTSLTSGHQTFNPIQVV